MTFAIAQLTSSSFRFFLPPFFAVCLMLVLFVCMRNCKCRARVTIGFCIVVLLDGSIKEDAIKTFAKRCGEVVL